MVYVISAYFPLTPDPLVYIISAYFPGTPNPLVYVISAYFPGTPDPLVFHAPQVFFDCLQQRISAGSRKKRLPNLTTSFVRKEALPLGTFTKFTWHITSVAQVKQIFDSPEVSQT